MLQGSALELTFILMYFVRSIIRVCVSIDDYNALVKPKLLTFLYMQYLEAAQLSVLLQEVNNLSASQNWGARHGSVLCISSLLKHNPSTIMTSSLFSSMLNSLKSSLKDEKVPS